MAIVINGSTGIAATGDTTIFQEGSIETTDIQDGAVTAVKIASGVVPTVPTAISSFTNDSGYLTSSTGVTAVNGSTGAVTVQPTLVSGTNIKSVNGSSLLGSGDLTVGSTPTTTQVLTALSGLTLNAIGTMTFGWWNNGGTISRGGTATIGTNSGQWRAAVIDAGNITSPGVNTTNYSGTWRNLCPDIGGSARFALIIRVA